MQNERDINRNKGSDQGQDMGKDAMGQEQGKPIFDEKGGDIENQGRNVGSENLGYTGGQAGQKGQTERSQGQTGLRQDQGGVGGGGPGRDAD
jgi:hypothetical protein